MGSVVQIEPDFDKFYDFVVAKISTVSTLINNKATLADIYKAIIDLTQAVQGLVAELTKQLTIQSNILSEYAFRQTQIQLQSAAGIDPTDKDAGVNMQKIANANQIITNRGDALKSNQSITEELSKKVQVILQSLNDLRSKLTQTLEELLQNANSLASKIH